MPPLCKMTKNFMLKSRKFSFSGACVNLQQKYSNFSSICKSFNILIIFKILHPNLDSKSMGSGIQIRIPQIRIHKIF